MKTQFNRLERIANSKEGKDCIKSGNKLLESLGAKIDSKGRIKTKDLLTGLGFKVNKLK